MSGGDFLQPFAIVGFFFLILGGAFVSLCAFYDDRVNGPLKGIQPYSRFLCLSVLAILLNFGMLVGGIVFADDEDSPSHESAQTERVLSIVYAVINAPLLAVAWLLRGNPFDAPFTFIVIFFLQGFVWGGIAEMLLRFGARLQARAVTQSTQIP